MHTVLMWDFGHTNLDKVLQLCPLHVIFVYYSVLIQSFWRAADEGIWLHVHPIVQYN